jgi:hypothetical protein
MLTCLSWIQPHPHVAIRRHLLNMVNLFLCSSTKYFENRLVPNDLIIVRNIRDDEEDKQDIKRVLERQGDAHNKVEIQFNWKFQSLTSSPTRSPGPPRLQIDVQDACGIGFRCSTYEQKEDGTIIPMEPVTSLVFDQNWGNNFNIQSPTRPGAVYIKTDAHIACDIQLWHSWTPWKGN